MTINHKDILDLMEWRSLSQCVNSSSSSMVSAPGTCIAEDYRNRDYASPLYFSNMLLQIWVLIIQKMMHGLLLI